MVAELGTHSSGCLPFLPSLPDALLVFPSPPTCSPCRWILISGSAIWGIKAKTRLVQEFSSPPSSPLASSTYKSYNGTAPLLKPQSNAFTPGETSLHFTSLAFFSTGRARGSIMQLPHIHGIAIFQILYFKVGNIKNKGPAFHTPRAAIKPC